MHIAHLKVVYLTGCNTLALSLLSLRCGSDGPRITMKYMLCHIAKWDGTGKFAENNNTRQLVLQPNSVPKLVLNTLYCNSRFNKEKAD